MYIHLKKLIFFAQHGLYNEEKKLDNSFEVDVSIEIYQPQRIDSIHQTLNYVLVYEQIKKRIAIPTPLLETLAHDLIHEVHSLSPLIKSIFIDIKKLNPPIENFTGTVGVTLKKEFVL